MGWARQRCIRSCDAPTTRAALRSTTTSAPRRCWRRGPSWTQREGSLPQHTRMPLTPGVAERRVAWSRPLSRRCYCTLRTSASRISSDSTSEPSSSRLLPSVVEEVFNAFIKNNNISDKNFKIILEHRNTTACLRRSSQAISRR